MPQIDNKFNVEIVSQDHLVVLSLSGVVTIELVINMLDVLYANPAYQLSMGRLLNLEQATLDISRDEIEQIVNKNLSNHDGQTKYKVAVYVPSLIEKMLIQLFDRLTHELDYEELDAFTTYSEAYNWLTPN